MDVHNKEQRSKNMRAIKSKNTKIEILLGKKLWALGLRYRKNNKKIFGNPDFTFLKYKIAIFVDSEFFHGRNWENTKFRIQTNREFWWTKIEGNIKRDKTVNKKLKHDGWIVIRFWGEDVKKKTDKCINKINKAVERRKNTD